MNIACVLQKPACIQLEYTGTNSPPGHTADSSLVCTLARGVHTGSGLGEPLTDGRSQRGRGAAGSRRLRRLASSCRLGDYENGSARSIGSKQHPNPHSAAPESPASLSLRRAPAPAQEDPAAERGCTVHTARAQVAIARLRMEHAPYVYCDGGSSTGAAATGGASLTVTLLASS